MSNIEYLRQLHHKKLNLKRTQFHVKEFYSYEKDHVVRFCIKDLIFIYYVQVLIYFLCAKEPSH